MDTSDNSEEGGKTYFRKLRRFGMQLRVRIKPEAQL